MKKINISKPLLTFISLILILVMIFFTQSVYSKIFQENKKNWEGKIDLGKFGLYASILGKGKPSIIFESGHADDHETWSFIQSEMSIKNTTISYDRAGIGLSDNSTSIRTSLNKAIELHKLLKEAKVNGPYIIVSHSMGSWVSRMFTEQYGNELAGLIFVDPTHEETNAYTLASISPDFLDSYKNEIFKEGTYEDMLKSIDQIKESKLAMKKVPLTVISSNNHQMGTQFEEKWSLWQNDIASLSSKSQHITVNCSHNIPSENPYIIIKAINDMLEKNK